MDEDHNDLDDFDIDQLFDVLDEMFPHGHAVMPDGTPLCLCGRDLGSDEVMTEIAKAAALVVEFDLVLDGCVMEAAAAYDTIHKGLKTGPARRSRQSMSNARTAVEAPQWPVTTGQEPLSLHEPGASTGNGGDDRLRGNRLDARLRLLPAMALCGGAPRTPASRCRAQDVRFRQ